MAPFGKQQEILKLLPEWPKGLASGDGGRHEAGRAGVRCESLDATACATDRRYCEVMTAPVMIQKPDIASLGGLPGGVHVRFQVAVLTDGSVGTIQVIAQNSGGAADGLRKLWKGARYEPAMCGTEPVVADEEAGSDIAH